jgi:polyhydroxyalkanoic acid synthase PhaR subunit
VSQSADKPESSRPADAFELWRQVYETNERAWNAVLERTVNNPAFAESTGKILETFLSAQKTVRDNMRTYLEQINLPTREDIARLGELIVALEEKVDQLDDRLAAVDRSLAAAQGSSAQLDDRLARLERAVTRLSEERAASAASGAASSSTASPASGARSAAPASTAASARRASTSRRPKDTPR